MQDPQEIFMRIQETKKKAKDIRQAYKEALDNSQEYKDLVEQMKKLRERKKQIENTVRAEFSSEFTKLDDFKIDLESDNAILSDAVLTKIMKGETVEVKDEYENAYEPIFNVRFKKT